VGSIYKSRSNGIYNGRNDGIYKGRSGGMIISNVTRKLKRT